LVTSDSELSHVGDSIELSRIVPVGGAGTSAVLRRPGFGADLRIELPAPASRAPILVETLGEGRALLTVDDPAADLDELWLDVAYTGDLVRLFDAGSGILVGDDFSRGIPWRLRLGRFERALRGPGLQLRVEPVSSVVEVANEEGILFDHSERPEGDARIDGLEFSERVTAQTPIAALL
jgi:hypothetical protein